MAQTLPNPITAAMVTPANANVTKPRYDSMTDWAGGGAGADPGRPDAVNAAISSSRAAVALANSSGGAAEADYTPRTQNARLIAGQVAAADIGRERGAIAPGQRYPVTGDPAPAAPVVSSISPTTGAQASLPLLVTITGTGFTPFSRVFTGGASTPDGSAKYVDATHMTVPIWKASPGTVSVAVEDHSVLSNTDKVFTVT